jgi:DNA end-binding protein Ku
VGKERALWTGAVSFGLVTIPVRIHPATASHDVAFHQYEEKTGRRIHIKRVAENTGREVPYQKIVKGYPVAKGKVVLIEPEELAALEPRKTRTIELEQFVDMGEIDPIFWDKTYYLAPEDHPGARKSFELLRRAMEETGKVGIGRFVMRTKEYLATIRPLGEGLALETMFFPDEIRDQSEVVGGGKKLAVASRELDMAKQLIGSFEQKWKPGALQDTYRDRVMELIHKKARGEEIVQEEAPEPEGRVVDLMQALKDSLAGSRQGARKSPASAPGRKGRKAKQSRGRRAGKRAAA